jgi:hypothetical protein
VAIGADELSSGLVDRERPAARAQSFSSIVGADIAGTVARREAKRAKAKAATFSLAKAVTDPDRRTIAGWASVATVKGAAVTDQEADQS